MSIMTLLNAPWAQPLVALVVTLLASWLGSRRSSSSGTINLTATTSGAESPVTQTANYEVISNTWHVHPRPTARSHSHDWGSTSGLSDSGSRINDPEEDFGQMIAAAIIALLTVAALTWGVARHWGAVSLTVRVLVIVALFGVAFTWRRWPQGVTGAWGVRLGILGFASLILYSLATLPIPVRKEPSLATIDKVTHDLGIGESITTTFEMLQPQGLAVYAMRLGGIALMIFGMALMARRAYCAVIAESGARRTPPRMRLVNVGNWLIGTATIGSGYFGKMVLLATLGLLFVYPASVGWLVDYWQRSSG